MNTSSSISVSATAHTEATLSNGANLQVHITAYSNKYAIAINHVSGQIFNSIYLPNEDDLNTFLNAIEATRREMEKAKSEAGII